jgi:hypothetical protein
MALDMGPVELLAVKFPGNQFRGEIAPALGDLVKKGDVRIIDFVFVLKDAAGEVAAMEIGDLEDAAFESLDPIVSDVNGMLGEEDIEDIASALEPNSSAGILLFEHLWARRFADALRNANGELIYSERIPHEAIEKAMSEAA